MKMMRMSVPAWTCSVCQCFVIKDLCLDAGADKNSQPLDGLWVLRLSCRICQPLLPYLICAAESE
jgi:hypothetical protein